MVLDDNSIYTRAGSHKGKKLKDIPDGWFIWMYDRRKLSPELMEYAEDRIAILEITRRLREEEGKEKKT